MTTGRGILSHPDFRRLWIADLLSQLGSRLGMMAVPLLAVLTLNASTLQVSLLRTCETAAWLLLGLFAGAWVDRVRCLPVLVAADLGRALLYASIPVAAAFGVLSLPQLYVVLAATGLLTVLFDVAHSSYPPRLLSPEQLLPGNARLAANHSVAAVVGAGAGGVLVQWLTAPITIGLNALGFLWSAVWLRSIRTPEPRPAPQDRPNLRREIGEGLRYVFRHPLLRPITLNTATTMLFQAAGNAVMIVFLVREIHLSPATIGLLSMIGLLGALAASALTERISRWMGDARALLVAAIGMGFAFSLQALTRPGWGLTWYVAGTLLAAICIIVGYILQVSTRQRVCPPELQGRVSATMSFVSWGAAPIGSLLGGILGTVFGLRPTLWIAGAAMLAGSAWLIFSPFRTLRSVPTEAESLRRPA
ncbi:putative MFS family arabinose efflux permease [Kribbella amoyensis]|uniref:Putative MFS family arabinose efflux permease n=1 Tax=Kribbella amoyensis TaxID=996641 RepID=A0A561B3G3_9ACTN|nr:MFS transporter [Kribbella amoyensis]TWD73399.1 putative MFS family arabinose efflux permease [Kribbella amoyensis]